MERGRTQCTVEYTASAWKHSKGKAWADEELKDWKKFKCSGGLRLPAHIPEDGAEEDSSNDSE